MKIKNLLTMGLIFGAGLCLVACGNSSGNDNTKDPTDPKTPTNTEPEDVTIFLAGDSTVKTYNENQYIGGWGQYLDKFFDDNVTVKNCAQGGRSSRSFINEGRLYDIDGGSYAFSENGGNSIADDIKEGDYLFIQFGHNDDDTKFSYAPTNNYSTVFDRMVPLGTPDSNGIYPVELGTKVSTSSLPSAYTTYAKSTEQSSALAEIKKYGSTYYSYDCGGTYKGYLKAYVDFAREHGATPVLVTPVARVKFSGNQIVGGPGLHGEDFAYVKAVRQLASEEDCMLIDLFSYTKTMLETATSTYANYTMALKPNSLTGVWPSGYDKTYNNTSLGYEGIEATHYNKYGAFLTAARAAEVLKASTETHKNGTESIKFSDSVNETPSEYVSPSNMLPKAKINELEATITGINVTDPNRVFPNSTELEAKLAEIPAVADINESNYKAVEALLEEAKNLYVVLNVDDRKSEYKTKIDETEAKVEAIYEALKPVATNTYSLDFSTMTSLADITSPFVFNETTADKHSISSKCLKFGANGSTEKDNLAITLTGTGTVTITIKAYSGFTEKTCLLGVSDGTDEKKESITEGTAQKYTFEFTISGTKTFYIYRAAGSGTGVMCQSICVEYFQN